MKILWLTESPLQGKIPRDFPNMRTEMAWMCSSEGQHYHIGELPNIQEVYDFAIIIIPKREDLLRNMSTFNGFDLVGNMRRVADKIGWMQEGPVNYYQDYNVGIQVWWYSVLSELDFLMVHNERDRKYISGLFPNKQVFVNQSLMIEAALPSGPWHEESDRQGVMIGGNFVSWYGGFDSYMVATELSDEIYAPTMGRMPESESGLQGIKHIEYKTWQEWQTILSQRKYGIHLMPTFAAGTFALNCSRLGIPCIGYKGLDTQETLHPDLSVDLFDIDSARALAAGLHDEKRYNEYSERTKTLYEQVYSEDNWKRRFFGFLEHI